MTWVYVESNFILELVFAQSQRDNCRKLLELAEVGNVDLAIPAYCLAEPLETLGRRHKERRALQHRLQEELRQLNRTSEYSDIVQQVNEVTELFVRSRIEERSRLEEVIGRVTATAALIPLEASTMASAFELASRFDLPPQDALVLASVLDHRATVRAAGLFVTTNEKDFDDPELRDLLASMQCDLETRFGAAVGHFLG